MKTHPNSPHLSIKRLRELTNSFLKANWKQIAQEMDISDKADQMYLFQMFLEHVESQRSLLGTRPLTSKHVKK